MVIGNTLTRMQVIAIPAPVDYLVLHTSQAVSVAHIAAASVPVEAVIVANVDVETRSGRCPDGGTTHCHHQAQARNESEQRTVQKRGHDDTPSSNVRYHKATSRPLYRNTVSCI